jgi:hypothetical protein
MLKPISLKMIENIEKKVDQLNFINENRHFPEEYKYSEIRIDFGKFLNKNFIDDIKIFNSLLRIFNHKRNYKLEKENDSNFLRYAFFTKINYTLEKKINEKIIKIAKEMLNYSEIKKIDKNADSNFSEEEYKTIYENKFFISLTEKINNFREKIFHFKKFNSKDEYKQIDYFTKIGNIPIIEEEFEIFEIKVKKFIKEIIKQFAQLINQEEIFKVYIQDTISNKNYIEISLKIDAFNYKILEKDLKNKKLIEEKLEEIKYVYEKMLPIRRISGSNFSLSDMHEFIEQNFLTVLNLLNLIE